MSVARQRLRLRLLGGFRLEDAAGAPVALTLRKAEALLAYLAVGQGQAASRDALATLLWGDFDQRRARQSLRQVLLVLSRALGPALRVEGQWVAVVPAAIDIDVAELESVAAAAPSPAVLAALYRGLFLAGLAVEAPEFEAWLETTRARTENLVLAALGRVLARRAAAGDLQGAVEAAVEALRIDPTREDFHRRLMELYWRQGLRGAALAQYRSCREVLARELDAPPDQATTALMERILARQDADPARPDPESATPTTPARNTEAAAVLAAHYRACAGATADGAAFIAGARAELARGNAAEARAILEQAPSTSAALDGGPTEVALHLLACMAAEWEGDLDGAWAALDRGEGLAQRIGATGTRASIGLARARLVGRREGLEAAFEAARLALAAGPGHAEAWLPGERFLTGLHLIDGRSRQALDRVSRHVRRCRAAGLPGDEARALALRALMSAVRGRPARAKVDARAALARAAQCDCETVEAACLQAQGLVRLWYGEGEAAVSSFSAGLSRAEARGDPLRGYVFRGLLGLALAAAERRAEALAQLEAAVGDAERLGTGFMLPYFKACHAEVLAPADAEQGLRSSRAAARLAARANQPWAQSIALRAQAGALARGKSPDLVQAARAVRTGLAIQRGLGLTFEVARSRRVLVSILLTQGDRGDSRPRSLRRLRRSGVGA